MKQRKDDNSNIIAKEEGSVSMQTMTQETIIRGIIEQEEAPYKRYSDYQKRRLAYLRNLKNLPIEEQEAERQRIIKKWQEIGILDENGELSEYYRRGENE